jgi:hypothetical protein
MKAVLAVLATVTRTVTMVTTVLTCANQTVIRVAPHMQKR